MPAADLEVVEIVRRGDLHRTRSLFGIGIIIGDDRDEPADERQPHVLAMQMGVALVMRMHGDGGVAEHRLRPRRRDGDERAGVASGGVDDRIFEMPEMALRLDLLDLEIGNRGLQLRVPVDEALVLVDQPFAVELDEHLAHGRAQSLVHGEAFARPVAGGAEPLQLVDDRAARLRLPRPDPFEKFRAAQGATIGLLAFRELALDDHLRRDAGMVGARLPQHVLAAHALEAGENVLQRIVERMAHVQVAGDVRRRDDDRERLRRGALRPSRLERALLPPTARRCALRWRRDRKSCPSWLEPGSRSLFCGAQTLAVAASALKSGPPGPRHGLGPRHPRCQCRVQSASSSA